MYVVYRWWLQSQIDFLQSQYWQQWLSCREQPCYSPLILLCSHWAEAFLQNNFEWIQIQLVKNGKPKPFSWTSNTLAPPLRYPASYNALLCCCWQCVAVSPLCPGPVWVSDGSVCRFTERRRPIETPQQPSVSEQQGGSSISLNGSMWRKLWPIPAKLKRALCYWVNRDFFHPS